MDPAPDKRPNSRPNSAPNSGPNAGLDANRAATPQIHPSETQARAALKRGDLQAAATAAKALVDAEPDRPEGYFLLGMIAAEAGQVAKAVPLIQAAVQRGPQAEHLAQLARLLILLRRDGEAAEAARRALALESQDARSLDTIGCVLARLGEHEASVAPFTAAVEAEPDNIDYRYNLAAASGFTGRNEDARRHYEAIIAADPGNARAHYALAILSRQSADSNHIPRLKAALAKAATPGDALRIRYALAKEMEDVGDAEAFAHLAAANAGQKRELRYDFAQDAAIFDAIEAAFSGAVPAGDGNPDPSPIFVVGMPRTGTTLVDRILSSHPDVTSAGELQAMPLAVKRLSGTRSRTIVDPETVRQSMQADPAAIGSAYLAQAGHHHAGETPRFTDKLPANFLYVGHIARALPHARIVCLRRNPMDTVWSNFKNLFASESAYYAYSYDLMDTARYYARFDRLMALWDRLFPGRVLSLSYEGLVADQEGQTRRLLDHCGLTWDAACLSFHENTAAVATPSAAQVRRPINADGVGKWRTHAEGLEPVRAWLAQQGFDVSA
ncbi:MAG: sulfotransferase [Croceicoccus sp.]|mgnify:CR=1 FL=1|uniref:tetratricopeptide repeat-containing sulfotransferase family protein n=1 Tax=Brevirhabdus sp. TaxID=2004514 RepID=UPI000C0B67B3|nr:sulfotransferase [Croceicoccus sp.]MAL25096.1 sulfotransferase [Croceicoccus sp.]|tara:strand:+ start:34449 stop:36113 length:1665 start_codon:yes stop_codon:yes gene_type:complete